MKRPRNSTALAHSRMKIQLLNNLIKLQEVPSGNWKNNYFQMKKTIIAALALLVINYTSSGQGFYITAGLGYAFPQAAQTIDGTATPYNGTRNTTTYNETYSIKTASFSSGTQSSLGVGYQFSEHVSAQLDASIGLSSTKYTFVDENISYGGYNANESIIQQANTPFLLVPSIVVQSGGSSPWNVYARLGIVVPLSTKITQDDVYLIPSTGEIDDYTAQIKNSFSLGFSAAAGVQYKFNDRMSVWGELSILSMSQYIKQLTVTGVSVNGSPATLSGQNTYTFSKNATVDTNGYNQPTYSQPFSNVGFKFGFTFRLSSKSSYKGKKHDDDIDNTKPFRRR